MCPAPDNWHQWLWFIPRQNDNKIIIIYLWIITTKAYLNNNYRKNKSLSLKVSQLQLRLCKCKYLLDLTKIWFKECDKVDDKTAYWKRFVIGKKGRNTRTRKKDRNRFAKKNWPKIMPCAKTNKRCLITSD